MSFPFPDTPEKEIPIHFLQKRPQFREFRQISNHLSASRHAISRPMRSSCQKPMPAITFSPPNEETDR
jgi:hypothetical protein